MNLPLHGVRVMELGSFIAVPYAASILASLGAEVVKVEPLPPGDPFRRGRDADDQYFAQYNAGKKSLSADLKNARGRVVVERLLKTCDVLIHNLRPGKAEKLGLPSDYQSRVNSEAPQHRVQITRPFYLSTTEVTVGQFKAFVKARSYATEASLKGGTGLEAGKELPRSKDFDWITPGPGYLPTDDHPELALPHRVLAAQPVPAAADPCEAFAALLVALLARRWRRFARRGLGPLGGRCGRRRRRRGIPTMVAHLCERASGAAEQCRCGEPRRDEQSM